MNPALNNSMRYFIHMNVKTRLYKICIKLIYLYEHIKQNKQFY